MIIIYEHNILLNIFLSYTYQYALYIKKHNCPSFSTHSIPVLSVDGCRVSVIL